MDAASQKTFDKLRPGKDGQSKFQTIIDGMKELAKIKRGELGFSFLIRTEADGFGIESNIDEIFDAAILAKKNRLQLYRIQTELQFCEWSNSCAG